MKIVVAIYSPFRAWCIPDANIDWLRGQFRGHTFVRADDAEATLGEIADADIAFSSQITAAHLRAAARLRWIHSPAAGVGSMLSPEMIASPIVMTNSRGTSAVTIAEHTIAVTLALLRKLPLTLQRQTEGVWAQLELYGEPPISTLRGQRVLIIGLGAIGSETARLAAAFGAEVIGLRRHIGRKVPAGVTRVASPDALHAELPHADLVVVAAPETGDTQHLVGARELALLQPHALLVNVSRGKLVDEAALVAALETGRLRGAALDVFEHEPLDPASPLWHRSDVLITPHVSAFHAHFWRDITDLFADNLRRYLAGERLCNLVDKAAGY
jgi:phosphoglycerate dehydrogenase-like enzyme